LERFICLATMSIASGSPPSLEDSRFVASSSSSPPFPRARVDLFRILWIISVVSGTVKAGTSIAFAMVSASATKMLRQITRTLPVPTVGQFWMAASLLSTLLKPLKHEISVLVWRVGGGIPFQFKPLCRIIERFGYLCWRITRDPQNYFFSTRPEPVSEF